MDCIPFQKTRNEALRQLGEEFNFFYEGLILEPDENLTQDAIEQAMAIYFKARQPGFKHQ